MRLRTTLRFGAAACLLALPLVHPGTARGADRLKAYLTDGAKGIAPNYANPDDGFCVSGLKTDGTMTVVPGITNFRDCVAYTTGLTGMTATDVTATSTCGPAGTLPCNVAANCTKVDGSLAWVAALQKCFNNAACTVQGAPGNDGARHTYSTNLCINPLTRDGISLVDLDRTAANCQTKGGVLSDGLYGHAYGACSAYGWIYGGVKADGTLPDLSGGKGVTSADNLGFCYASMRMTTAPGYNVGTVGGCPSYHNSATGNAAEWPLGTDAVAYQTIASYDAGLGWSFASSQCLYQYSVKGYLGSDLRGVNGAIPTVTACAGGTVTATAGSCVDLTGITTQGDCMAIGASWDNYLPTLGGVAPGAALVSVATTPIASSIRKLDAITSVADGGAKFYSGTGAVCLKCHADQSRAYQERNKPGYVETGHKLSGDTAPWTGVGAEWDLKGVQCTMCHATGKPTQQDVGLIVYSSGAQAGKPRAASGHNQTEYGSHVTGVCFYCHGTQTVPDTGNPAAVIPVLGGDFALTAKSLAPIANQFLNSPHARYTGDSKTLSVITKTNYASRFKGNICRTGSEVTDAATAANGVTVTALSTCGAAGTSSCNSATNCPATPGGNRTWNPITSQCYDRAVCAGAAGKTWDAVTNRCVETQATCTAQSDSGYNFIWSPAGVAGNPSIITASGAGCYKPFGSGSIVTTWWDGSAARRIHNLDTATNPACSDSTGAAAFWTGDGEAVASGAPATDQGNCMTCHDVHWSLESTHPEAEPIRRECTTCHSHPTGETSVTNAPQIVLSRIHHPGGGGTPLAGTPDEACETCHMPKSSAGGSPMHLWRVNTDVAYSTMGTTQANTAPDGTYANAAWVDVDFACGQCHGGSSPTTTNGAPYFTKAQLSTLATDIHAARPTAAFTGSVRNANKTFTVDASASVCNGDVLNCDSFTWAWGDSTTTTVSKPTPNPWLSLHTYAAAGTYTVQLTVSQGGLTATTSRVITIFDITPPTVGGVCTFDPNTWRASVTDSASSAGSKTITKVVVNWGDGTPYGISNTFPVTTPIVHTYLTAGSFTVSEQVIDSGGQSTTSTLTCTPAVVTNYFTISGVVRQSNNTTPIVSAVVKIMRGTVVVKSLFTDALGAYNATRLTPGTYTVVVTKTGFTFGAAPSVTVGGSQTVNINSLTP